jgi:polysaccharide chain length determinant protein (PEP-CTERM system associated)
VSNFVEGYVDIARQAVRTVLRRRWLALGVAAGVAVISAVVVALVPNRYEASAKVYVDTQSVLKPALANLTYQPDIDQQVNMLARTLISRPNVEQLVKIPELELDVATAGEREDVISRLMKQIKILPAGAGNLYEISYKGPSPDRARRLVEATVSMFVHANTGEKVSEARKALQFIQDQIKTYEVKLTDSESRLKDFKVRNFGVSGVSSTDYFARVSALAEVVTKLRLELNAAEQSRDSFRRELLNEDPQLPVELAPKNTATPLGDAEARLEIQKKRLDELLSRYTEAHPDVTSTRRVISQLEAEVKERRDIEDRAPNKRAGKAPTSPVYQKLRVSLAEAEALVASTRAQLGAQQAQLEQVRSAAGRVPQVEAELAQLNRDYDIIRKQYDEMVARREQAILTMKLTESTQLADFRVVEPPRVLPMPVFPNRLHLALIAILATFIAGAGATILADRMLPTIDGLAALRQMSGRAVLGSVSILVTPDIQRARRASLLRFVAGIGLLLAIQAAWVAWIAVKSSPAWIQQ